MECELIANYGYRNGIRSRRDIIFSSISLFSSSSSWAHPLDGVEDQGVTSRDSFTCELPCNALIESALQHCPTWKLDYGRINLCLPSPLRLIISPAPDLLCIQLRKAPYSDELSGHTRRGGVEWSTQILALWPS